MKSLEIARKLAEAGMADKAQQAYEIFLMQTDEEKSPKDELEAASYIFFSKGDYKLAYTIFVSLYNRGLFHDELMNIMLQAFYMPNIQDMQKRYNANIRALQKYPYFFRTDFPDFEDLPIMFFPYDKDRYIPFFKAEDRFGEYTDFNNPVVDRWLFRDLSKPVLAEDVYSQYQLNYLCDTIRKSEVVGQDNHLYLHYTDWETFCAYLQCISFVRLLKEEKPVFLIGEEEAALYPLDFKQRFGIDYSQYTPRPIAVSEVKRLIWHTQLSSHNGGDFFNEILFDHPNILMTGSIMQDNLETVITDLRKAYENGRLTPDIAQPLKRVKNPMEKDFLVAYCLSRKDLQAGLDNNARIAPALFLQPHFSHILYDIKPTGKNNVVTISSEQFDSITRFSIFRQFKYVKTFTPLRRFTTSCAASVRFMAGSEFQGEDNRAVTDALTERLLNRSYMIDPDERLFKDSVIVRFEDAKLNPEATFTALAEFLDIPYTESMTYCSGTSGKNPVSFIGNAVGFDTSAVYNTYDEFLDESARVLLEYFLRDAYKEYGYDLIYYKGEEATSAWVTDNMERAVKLNEIIRTTDANSVRAALLKTGDTPEKASDIAKLSGDAKLLAYNKNRQKIMNYLLHNPQFVSTSGQPLRFMRLLQPNPDLLVQPLYK